MPRVHPLLETRALEDTFRLTRFLPDHVIFRDGGLDLHAPQDVSPIAIDLHHEWGASNSSLVAICMHAQLASTHMH